MSRGLQLLFVICLIPALSGFAQEEPDRWDLMTLKEIGVDRFLAAHPDLDGKGVIVAVLDTGVDMGVEGLKTLPTGKVKVVECRDFSREGDLIWEEARLVSDGDKGEKLVDSKGRSLTGFREAIVGPEKKEGEKKEGEEKEGEKNEGEKNEEEAGSTEEKPAAAAPEMPDRLFIVFIEEEHFADTGVRDLNSDGDSKDVFGIVIYTVKDDDGLRYEAIVDVNGDGKLDDGVRCTDYWRRFDTFVLKGKKGGRRKLTMALNFYPDEKRLSVHFDDGGHGTHVAGIATGYRIHGQEGYNGMAPGARVMSLKIGNNRFSGGCTVTESVKKALDFGAKYAKDKKVPVVFNMSFGIGSEIETKSAIDKYVDDILWKNPGVVFVTSAGNEGPGLSSIGTPAAAVRGIAVGAILGPEAAAAQYRCNIDYEVPFLFSSRGGDTYKPDIMAPGSAASTVPLYMDRDHMNGTSMASPAAAGAIALLVDGLVRHEPAFEVDNALVLRAIKNSARHLAGWTVLDEGGGILDLPAAYEYALFLCQSDEGKALREYKIRNRGPAPGHGTAWWRISPVLPRPTDVTTFMVMPGFHSKMTAEEKARFYRAFDLRTDADWITLTNPIAYIKASNPASVGVMTDITGKGPGLHTGKVSAFRKSDDRVGGAPIREFDIPVSVLVPHRVTPENRGRFRVTGQLDPGLVERVFVEVPVGTTAITLSLRMLEGGRASWLSTSLVDPEGVERGGSGSVTEQGDTEAVRTIRGSHVVPGTWEIVVNSSIRSRCAASYDLGVTLSGAEFGTPELYGDDAGTVRGRVLVPFRCTQALPFSGTVSGRIDGFMKKEVHEVEGKDTFTHTIRLDNTTGTVTWNIDFDRETYGLFTDCVLRVEDPETGNSLRNGALGQRSGSISLTIPKTQVEPKEYRLVLMPAFSVEKDSKKWRFMLTEKLNFSQGPIKIDPVNPKNGRITLMPWDFTTLDFRMPGQVPAAPCGFNLNVVLEAASTGSAGLILRESVEM